MGRCGKRKNQKLGVNSVSGDDVDLGSLLKATKKGTNISHLIQYDLPQHSTEYSKHCEEHDKRRSNPNINRRKNKHTASYLHLEGMNYINANYRFVLKQNGDYKSQLLDPSIPPNEKDIVRVLVNNGDYHCPICLDNEFVAPRMTKCGHIFCLPCILTLFEAVRNDPKALKNNPNLKHALVVSCPLCQNTIKEKHILLPVLINPNPSIHRSPIVPNANVTMTLMYKPHGAINSIPMSQYLGTGKIHHGLVPLPNDVNATNWCHDGICQRNRMILTNNRFQLDCLLFEKENLQTQKIIDIEAYGADGQWFDKAIEKIDVEINNSATIQDCGSETDKSIVNGVSKIKISENFSLLSWPSESTAYYYYEYDLPNSKQTFVLSNIDSRVVRQIYLGDANAEIGNSNKNKSSLSAESEAEEQKEHETPKLPLELTFNVESINFEYNQVTDEMLSRLKYLGHYPKGKEISIVEVNWLKTYGNKYPPTISAELLKKLQTRSKNTKHKYQYEEKERIRGQKIREKEFQKVFSVEEEEEALEDEHQVMTKKNKKKNKTLEAWGASSYNGSPASDHQTVSENASNSKYNKTVWGTQIPVLVDPDEEARVLREQIEAQNEIENMIKEAKDNQKGKKGKKPKKIYLAL